MSDMEDLRSWILKILLPALVAISIKLAVQSKQGAMSWFNVITSFVCGIGSAYLASDLVTSSINPHYVPLVIAVIAISGEKIGFWLVYKFNVESFMEGVMDKFKSKQ
jgi:hypothetical protein